jgi:thiol-disulfide isomerase/thioredoxin
MTHLVSFPRHGNALSERAGWSCVGLSFPRLLSGWLVSARGAARRANVGLYSLLLTASCAALAGVPELQVGDAPPDIFGKSSNGDAIHLSDYRGKIVVISFWASWCGPCRKEQPLLVTMEKQATREKLIVLSVNWRQNYEQFREIKTIFKKMDTDVTLISDEDGKAGKAYGVRAIPHMIIVGRDGKIAAIHVGYSEEEIPTLVDEINSQWRKGAAAVSSAN